MSDTITPTAEATVPVDDASRKSYGQILKSSALIGGSTLLNVFFSILRTKAMAILLGASGIGLIRTYSSIADLARSLAGLGINNSGVRQIAEAVGTGDSVRISRTVTTLRRVAFYSGALGGIVLLALSKPISWLTFTDYTHVGSIALLALVVFFGDVSAGQSALIQGMRRIADLARLNILGAFYGTVFGIAIVYYRRDDLGVVASLVCVAGMGILTSWWYARKVKVESIRITFKEVYAEAAALVQLGVVFMASGLMSMAVTYFVNIILIRQVNLEAVGYYQAAWALGGLYMKFIVDAMGADFYPRLTAVATNKVESNRLVNEQTEVGLLMAGPGILGTLTFAPLVITLFYTSKFGQSTEILRWICLGMMLRVVTWPMGFILLARGERKIFFWTELFSNLAYAAFVWLGVRLFGIKGTGVAFFALYVLNFFVVWIVVKRLNGFEWSPENRRLGLLFIPLVVFVFVGSYLLPPMWAVVLGVVVTLPTGIYSLKTLCKLIPVERFPRVARGGVRWFLRVFDR
jgi:PST family polysaccharide transporter